MPAGQREAGEGGRGGGWLAYDLQACCSVCCGSRLQMDAHARTLLPRARKQPGISSRAVAVHRTCRCKERTAHRAPAVAHPASSHGPYPDPGTAAHAAPHGDGGATGQTAVSRPHNSTQCTTIGFLGITNTPINRKNCKSTTTDSAKCAAPPVQQPPVPWLGTSCGRGSPKDAGFQRCTHTGLPPSPRPQKCMRRGLQHRHHPSLMQILLPMIIQQ